MTNPKTPNTMHTVKFLAFLLFSFLTFVALDAELFRLALIFGVITFTCFPYSLTNNN